MPVEDSRFGNVLHFTSFNAATALTVNCRPSSPFSLLPVPRTSDECSAGNSFSPKGTNGRLAAEQAIGPLAEKTSRHHGCAIEADEPVRSLD